MKLYFSGAEIPGWRNTLAQHGATHASLSYMGLRRRIKHPETWSAAQRIRQPLTLLLDSGAHTLNKHLDRYDVTEAMQVYEQFAAANKDTFEHVLEMDVLDIDGASRAMHRTRMGESLGWDKFVPVWHAEDGADSLDHLARSLQRLGGTLAIADLEADGKNLTPTLRYYAARVPLIGLAQLKPEPMREIPWYAVTGTSWLSPTQHGETVIYTGHELHRYHARYKDQVRKRYRTQIEAAGFDPAKIEVGDGNELLGLSLWSWRTFAAQLAANSPETTTPENEDPMLDGPANPESETEHPSARVPATPRATTALPGLSLEPLPQADEESGEPATAVMRIGEANLRECNSCYLKGKCPGYEASAACRYEIPVELKTPEQIKALRTALLTMQVDRILFLRFVEQVEGGYADPVLSAEIDRVTRMLAMDHKFDEQSLSINIRGTAGAMRNDGGIMSRVFGRDPQERRAIEPPLPADPIISQILDAEVVTEAEER